MTFAYTFDHPHDLSHDEAVELVGGKGANLAVMTQDPGLRVPPGFTISIEACRAFPTPAGSTREEETAAGRV